MMAYERAESAQDNFGKFPYQLQPKTKTLVRKPERILIKLYRQNMSLSNMLKLRTTAQRHTRYFEQIYLRSILETHCS